MFEFFADNFSSCVALAVLLVALCPAVESKIAIPFALSVQIWGENVLSPVTAFLVSYVGCMLPVALVIWLARKIKNKTCGFVCEKYSQKVSDRYQMRVKKLGEKNSTLQKCVFLASFVAVPLPMTGIYTGGLIGGLSNLKFWQVFASIAVGEFVSCLVVLLICVLFENSAFYFLIATLIICALVLIYNILLNLFVKLKSKKKNPENI